MIISQFFFHFFLQKFILWSSKWWKQTSYQSCRRCDRLSSTSPKNHWQWSKRTCHWCAVESVILWWFKTNHHRWSSFGPCQYCHYSSFGMGSQWIRKWHTLDHSFEKFIWNSKVWGEEEIILVEDLDIRPEILFSSAQSLFALLKGRANKDQNFLFVFHYSHSA